MVYDRDTANGMLGVAHRTSRRRKLRGCLKKSQLEPGQQQRLGQQQTCGHCSALPCSASQHDPSSCSCVSHLHNDDDRIIQSSTSSRRRLSGSEENVSCSSSSLYKRKKVSFDLLHIAIFPIQLGDNPAVVRSSIGLIKGLHTEYSAFVLTLFNAFSHTLYPLPSYLCTIEPMHCQKPTNRVLEYQSNYHGKQNMK